MRRTPGVFGLSALILMSVAARPASLLKAAQKAGTAHEKDHAGSNDPAQMKPESVYRVDYVIHELENGKRTNTRNYTLMVAAGTMVHGGDWTGFHVGSRVPVSMGHESFTYFDLGVKINSRLKEGPDKLLVETSLEINSVAAPDGSSSATPAPQNVPHTPVIRSLNLSSVTQATPGKPALVGSVDDVMANRRYEIEVTAIRAK